MICHQIDASTVRQRRHRCRRAAKQQWILGLSFGCLLIASTPGEAQTSQKRPTLNIFSTQVIENIKETGNAARSLESDLQSVIEELDQHQRLYEQSKCEGALDDQGCGQISRQMAETYKTMLDKMAERLPEMERNITITRDSLEKRLAKEMGRSRTGRDLQQLLRAQGQSAQQRTRVRRKGASLSDRFRQYFNLVNQGSKESLALLGAEMYLDMDETLEFIQLTQQQIHRAKLVVDLSETFGTITPEMESTVSGAKRIIFGEYEEEHDFIPAELDAAKKPEKFCSEFDPNC